MTPKQDSSLSNSNNTRLLKEIIRIIIPVQLSVFHLRMDNNSNNKTSMVNNTIKDLNMKANMITKKENMLWRTTRMILNMKVKS